jgi:hypothetical protein
MLQLNELTLGMQERERENEENEERGKMKRGRK